MPDILPYAPPSPPRKLRRFVIGTARFAFYSALFISFTPQHHVSRFDHLRFILFIILLLSVLAAIASILGSVILIACRQSDRTIRNTLLGCLVLIPLAFVFLLPLVV